MKREQLEHILRAASQIAGDPNVLISHFHAAFGYYAQGVNLEVATLPAGWLAGQNSRAHFAGNERRIRTLS